MNVSRVSFVAEEVWAVFVIPPSKLGTLATHQGVKLVFGSYVPMSLWCSTNISRDTSENGKRCVLNN